MGFMNYCLSLGLAFFAVALFWRGRGLDWAIGVALTALTLLAHAVGFSWLIGTAVYILLAERIRGWARLVLFPGALLVIVAAHIYVSHHFRTASPVGWHFRSLTGADQLVLYGYRYNILRRLALLLALLCFAVGMLREENKREVWRALRTPIELWAMLLFATAMLWGEIFFPQHGAAFGLIATRLSSITGVLGLCILGCVRLRRWNFAGWMCLAVVFFSWMYQDTAVLNRMEAQVETLVKELPYGRRVIQTVFALPGSRVVLSHIVARACIGRCFVYSNYEAAGRQFRVRARPGNPIVTDSADAGEAMELGRYVVRPEDLPMTDIYQCDLADLTRLCSRDLVAGEVNGRIGYHPPGLY